MKFTNSKYSPLYTSPTNLNQSHQSTAIYVKFSIVATPGYHPDPSHPAHSHPHWWRFAVGKASIWGKISWLCNVFEKLQRWPKWSSVARRDRESVGMSRCWGWGRWVGVGSLNEQWKEGPNGCFSLGDEKKTVILWENWLMNHFKDSY